MSCIDPEIGQLKDSYHLLEESADRARFESHVKICAFCEAEVEQLRLFAASLREEFNRHISNANLFEFTIGDFAALPESKRDQIEHHLASCAECRVAYEEYRAWAAQVDAQVPVAMPSNPAPLPFIDKEARTVASRVMQKATEAGLIADDREHARRRYKRIAFWLTGAAAILAIAAVAGLDLLSGRNTTSPVEHAANSNDREKQQTQGRATEPDSENRNAHADVTNRTPSVAQSKPPDETSAVRSSPQLRSGTVSVGMKSLSEVSTMSIDKQSEQFDEKLRDSLKEHIEAVTLIRIVDEEQRPDARLTFSKSNDRQYRFEVFSSKNVLFRHLEMIKDMTAERADSVGLRVAREIEKKINPARRIPQK